jgi:hypothetical protein
MQIAHSLEWVRGFQAAREQAAKLVETGVVSASGSIRDRRPEVVAEAIRVMQPDTEDKPEPEPSPEGCGFRRWKRCTCPLGKCFWLGVQWPEK